MISLSWDTRTLEQYSGVLYYTFSWSTGFSVPVAYFMDPTREIEIFYGVWYHPEVLYNDGVRVPVSREWFNECRQKAIRLYDTHKVELLKLIEVATCNGWNYEAFTALNKSLLSKPFGYMPVNEMKTTYEEWYA